MLSGSATDSDTSIADLVDQLNQALDDAGLGSTVVAAFRDNQIVFRLVSFEDGTTLQIRIPDRTDPMITVLGFGDGQIVQAVAKGLYIANATAGASLDLAMSPPEGGGSWVAGRYGQVGIAIGQGALSSSGTFVLELGEGEPVSLETLKSSAMSTAALEALISITETPTITASFTGVSVTPSSPVFQIGLGAQPAITVQAIDALDRSNALRLPSDLTNGNLGSNLHFQLSLAGRDPVAITVTAGAMAGNHATADLVQDINQALLAADSAGWVEALVEPGNSHRIVFRTTDTAPAGTALTVANFVTVNHQDLGDLAGFNHLTTAQVITALESAVNALGHYASLGALDQKLPLINRSLANLVDYGAALSTILAHLADQPAATLQQLGDTLFAALGLPADSDGLIFSYDAAHASLKIAVRYQAQEYDEYLPLGLDIQALSALGGNPSSLQGILAMIAQGGSARLHVQASAMVSLDLGIDLSDPTDPTPYLDSGTNVQASVLISTQNATFDVLVGALGLTVVNGGAVLSQDGSTTASPATFAVELTGNFDLAQPVQQLAGLVSSSLIGGVGASLPLRDDTSNPLGTLALTIPSLESFLQGAAYSVQFQTPIPDLAGLVGQTNPGALLRNPQVFVNPLEQSLMTQLQAALNSQVLGAGLPMVGSQLMVGAQFITMIQNRIITPMNVAIKNSVGDPTPAIVAALNAALDGSLAYPAAATRPDTQTVQFNLPLSGASTFKVPFDLGLPALGLRLDATMNVQLAWVLNLQFGLSIRQGLYISTAPTGRQGEAVSFLTMQVQAGLDSRSSTALLGYLPIQVSAAGSSVSGSIQVQLASPEGNGRLTVAQLVQSPMTSRLSGKWTGTTGFQLSGNTNYGANGFAPPIALTLDVNWPFTDWRMGSTPRGSQPAVEFRDVKIPVRDLLVNFLKPMLDDMRPFFNRIEGFVTFMSQRVPLISDLMGRTITVLTLFDLIGGTSNGSPATLVDTIKRVFDLQGKVGGAANDSAFQFSSREIQFGTFDLVRLFGDLRTRPSLSTATFNAANLPAFTSVGNQLTAQGIASSSPAGSFFSTLLSTSSFSVPLLTGPSTILRMLTGQSQSLITFDTGQLDLKWLLRYVFGSESATEKLKKVLPESIAKKIDIGLQIAGHFNLSARLAFGYDTTGLERFGNAGGNSTILADLNDGFYVVAGGKPAISYDFGLTVGLGVALPIVLTLGIDGGLFDTLSYTINNYDGSGKPRLNSFLSVLKNSPQDLLSQSQQFYVQCFFFVDINLLFFQLNLKIPITPKLTLATVVQPSLPADPTLASLTGGTLRLNMGPNAGSRNTYDTHDGDEKLTVRHVSGAKGNETVSVSAFGKTQTYSNVARIVADGGFGNDTIDLSGVLSDATLTGGQGTNTIIGGSGTNTLVETGSNSYTLVNGKLVMTDSMGTSSDTYQNVSSVSMTGTSTGGASFTVSGYSGAATLVGQGTGNA